MHPVFTNTVPDFRVRYLRRVVPTLVEVPVEQIPSTFEGLKLFYETTTRAEQPSVTIVNVRDSVNKTITFGTAVYNPNDSIGRSYIELDRNGNVEIGRDGLPIVRHVNRTPYSRKKGIEIAFNNMLRQPVTVPLVEGRSVKNHFRQAVIDGKFGKKNGILARFINEEEYK